MGITLGVRGTTEKLPGDYNHKGAARTLRNDIFRKEFRQMATGDLALGQEQGALSARSRVINDFSINVATVNGSGSQSANSVLLRSIFGMGVPVSGKNLFPSNIAGLPTWYTIRASKGRLRGPPALERSAGGA